MTSYNPEIHHRRSIRLKGYDYSQEGLYFVTVCVHNRECLFGEIENGEMRLNEYGNIVKMVWDNLPQHYSNIALNAFVVMPNHIHGIIEITAPMGAGFVGTGLVGAGLKPAPTPPPPPPMMTTTKNHGLPEIIRALKTFSARQINELRNMQGEKLWQRNYHEHIIRNEQSYQTIAQYIENNPARWENDRFFNLQLQKDEN